MTKKAKKVEDIENLSAPVAPPEPETSVSEEYENKALPESSGEKKYARCKGSFHMFFNGSKVSFIEGQVLRDPGQIQRALKQHKPIEFVDQPF